MLRATAYALLLIAATAEPIALFCSVGCGSMHSGTSEAAAGFEWQSEKAPGCCKDELQEAVQSPVKPRNSLLPVDQPGITFQSDLSYGNGLTSELPVLHPPPLFRCCEPLPLVLRI